MITLLNKEQFTQVITEGLSIVKDNDVDMYRELAKVMAFCGYIPTIEEIPDRIQAIKDQKTCILPIAPGSQFAEQYPEASHYDYTTSQATEPVIVSSLVDLPDTQMLGFSVGEFVEHKRHGVGKIIVFVSGLAEPHARVDLSIQVKTLALSTLTKLKEEVKMSKSAKAGKDLVLDQTQVARINAVQETVETITNNKEEVKMTKTVTVEAPKVVVPVVVAPKVVVPRTEAPKVVVPRNVISPEMMAAKAAKLGVDEVVVEQETVYGGLFSKLEIKSSSFDNFSYRRVEGLATKDQLDAYLCQFERKSDKQLVTYLRVDFLEATLSGIEYVTIWEPFATDNGVAAGVSVKLTNGQTQTGYKVRYGKDNDGSIYLQDPTYKIGEGTDVQWKHHVENKGMEIFKAQVLCLVDSYLQLRTPENRNAQE